MAGLFGPVEVVGGIAVGTGVGAAVGDVVVPKLQDFLNSQWEANQHKPLSAVAVAEAIAEAISSAYASHAEGARTGIAGDRLDLLAELARTAPGVPDLLHGLRRGTLNPGNVAHGFRKAKLETMWDAFLLDLQHDRLSPQVIALAMVRGLIDDQGILPVGPPSATGRIRAFPTFPIDGVKEATDAGIDKQRLSVMVGTQGRPMGPEAAASAVFRNIIDRVDYDRAIAEGDVRNEWADAIFEQAKFHLSPTTGAGLRLRGHITAPESYAIGALSGATHDDMDKLWLDRGRPATTHQVHLGYARGGRNAATGNDERATFERAIKESDIRDEWTDILWSQRYTYPSAFVLRALVSDGTFTAAQGEQILIESGWRPDLAHQAATKWAAGTGSKTGAETKSELADEYIAGFIDESEYRTHLTALGLTGHEQDLEVLHAETAAIKAARSAAVTKLRAAYEKDAITQDRFAGALGQLGMHSVAIDREVQYANVVKAT